jgi:hypothetical protein
VLVGFFFSLFFFFKTRIELSCFIEGDFVARQISTILSLERLFTEWRAEALAAAPHQQSTPQPPSAGTTELQAAIQSNATRRTLRDAHIISILNLLIDAWKAHLTSGLAALSSAYVVGTSDLRVLQACVRRGVADRGETVEDILALGDRNGTTGTEDLAGA